MNDNLLSDMQSYVGFDEDDTNRLRALWPYAQPEIERIVDDFYARIQRFPTANAVFSGPEQVERLKRTMGVWLEELLRGPHDQAYMQRRTNIGRRHVAVGLPHHYMFTAMTVLANHLAAVAHRELPPAEAALTVASLHRATSLDLALMTGTYMTAREKKQAALLQELIVSRLPVTVMLVGHDGIIRAATQPGFCALGVEGPLDGRPFVDALPADLVEASGLVAEMTRACRRQESVRLTRVDVVLDGRERSFAIHIVPLEQELGGCLLHLEEFSAIVEAEARLRQAESLARIGELSAAVAHELRNPLAGISGAIQVISSGLAADDPRRSILDKVVDQIGRLNRMVRDLLDFARPKVPTPLLVDLEVVCRGVADLVRNEHPALDLRITGAGRALADADQVHRTLLNLVENAVQATAGKGRVEVQIGQGRVRVADDGPGVPRDLTTKIFEPFVTTRTQGTGLGLAICRKNARSLGGDLVLECSERGASFLLTLPSSPADAGTGFAS